MESGHADENVGDGATVPVSVEGQFSELWL